MSDNLSLKSIRKFIASLLCAIAMSGYLFPTTVFGAWGGPSSKIVLGAIGVAVMVVSAFSSRKVIVSQQLIFTVFIAFTYSIINYISTEINSTSDYTYANYFISFFTWLFGAYTVVEFIRWIHGEANLRLLSHYMLAVVTVQCVIALLIDYFPAVDAFVNDYFIYGTNFYKEHNRLYGIGAGLDPAGVRFTVALILSSFVLTHDEKVYGSPSVSAWYIVAFFIVATIGNMVSRTTIIGVILGFSIIVFSSITHRNSKSYNGNPLQPILIRGMLISIFFISISVLAYHLDSGLRTLYRFAFEGFFSFFETGKWATSSTDILQTMWVWPTNLRGWLIGYGQFENWVFGTDIGYCRLILYSGLIGFCIFALFFVYQLLIFIHKQPGLKLLMMALLSVVFIVWIKVSTDIFFVIAFFYCLDEYKSSNELQVN